jgi:cell division protein FtsI (penicillin-binding protein 3)
VRSGADPQGGRGTAARAGVVAVLLGLGLLAVAGRAFQLQVLRHGALAGEAAEQHVRELRLKPRRGVITDRNGVLLAGSADAQSAYLDPALLLQSGEAAPAMAPEAVLQQAARVLKVDAKAAQRKLARGNRFAWLARRIPPADVSALRAWLDRTHVQAIGLVPEARRYYPKAELAGQLLGFVDDDGAGREGVELFEDDDLQGVPADVSSVRDGRGRTILHEAPLLGREREGARVELTIDQGLQAVTEQALARAVIGSRALSGMAVAIDPRTGEVLAMASVPLANANAPRTPDELRDRPVTDAFEPGSTVKTFALSAALEAGTLQPLEAIDCGQGSYAIGGHVIHDHTAVGWGGPSRIIAQSSNIGAAKVAQKLGRDRLYQGLAAFGFGERTGSGLPGEVRGQLLVARSDIGLATQAFGQGPITATALQVTNAMAAIAAGGVLHEPHLVRRVVDPATGEVLDQAEPKVIRRAVSASTAATMTRWLAGVIEDPHGTGRRAALDGWRAAGKTGTAQKPDRISGGYSADRHFSSFVGFAPLEAPRIVIGVFVDEPKGEIYGGEVAAPAFKEIAEWALRTMGAVPGGTATGAVPAGTAKGIASDGAAKAVASDGVAKGVAADGAAKGVAADGVARGEAEPPAAGAVEWAEAGDARAPGDRVLVPPLAGLPARSALRTLEALDLGAELRGTGRVVDQHPPAGREVPRGARVRMTLAPAG